MTRCADPPCASMHFLREERVSLRARLPFIVAALVAHLALFAVTFPELVSAAPPKPPAERGPIVIERWVPPPPPITSRFLEAPESTLRVPVPDPLMDQIEPEIESAPLDLTLSFDDLALAGPTIEAASPPALPPLVAGTMGVGMPRLLEETKVQPLYPELARRAGVDARVVLKAIVRRTGEVGSVEVLSEEPLGLGFGESAIAAVRQWRYEPARLGGRSVDVSMSVVVRFTVD